MYTIYVTDRDDLEHKIEIQEGQKLMDVLRDAGLPIDAVCGGEGTCATCHIHVRPEWYDKLPEASSDELDFVESAMSFEPDCSRLSCQIIFNKLLDNMEITIADDE